MAAEYIFGQDEYIIVCAVSDNGKHVIKFYIGFFNRQAEFIQFLACREQIAFNTFRDQSGCIRADLFTLAQQPLLYPVREFVWFYVPYLNHDPRLVQRLEPEAFLRLTVNFSGRANKYIIGRWLSR